MILRLAIKSVFISSVILAVLLACPVSVFTAEQATEKIMEQAAEKAAEKAVEKALEKAAEEVVEKEERPDKWKGPTKVRYFVFVGDIDNINGAAQSFVANFYVRLRWKDKRLAKGADSIQQIPLEKVWNPRVLIFNQGGKMWESMARVVEVLPDGTVTYHQRYVGPLSQPLMLSNFPMDEHRFTIQFVAVGYRSNELEFVPDVLSDKDGFPGGTISNQLSLPDWEIVKYEVVSHPFEPIAGVSVAAFAFEFTAKRYFLYYLWQVILPLSLIVLMSCTVFWIDPSNVGSQTGVAASAILTLIAYRFVLAQLLPRLPYMTRMDYFMLGGTLLVFLALIEVVLTAALARRNYDRMAHNIHLFSRIAFPMGFLLLFGWFLLGE